MYAKEIAATKRYPFRRRKGPFTQDAKAHLHANLHAKPLMLLAAVWTLLFTAVCSIICVRLLQGAPRPVWTGPNIQRISCGTVEVLWTRIQEHCGIPDPDFAGRALAPGWTEHPVWVAMPSSSSLLSFILSSLCTAPDLVTTLHPRWKLEPGWPHSLVADKRPYLPKMSSSPLDWSHFGKIHKKFEKKKKIKHMSTVSLDLRLCPPLLCFCVSTQEGRPESSHIGALTLKNAPNFFFDFYAQSAHKLWGVLRVIWRLFTQEESLLPKI